MDALADLSVDALADLSVDEVADLLAVAVVDLLADAVADLLVDAVGIMEDGTEVVRMAIQHTDTEMYMITRMIRDTYAHTYVNVHQNGL